MSPRRIVFPAGATAFFAFAVVVGAQSTTRPAEGDLSSRPAASRADGRVDGRVVSDESGRPLEGAVVDYRAADGAILTTTTDADGAFVLDGLPRYALRILARAPLRTPESAWIYLNPHRSSVTATIRLPVARVLEGVVVDETGEPVAGASIAPRGGRHLPVRTRANGSFRAPMIDSLATVYDVFHPGFAPAAFRAENFEPKALVRERVVVVGRVVDASGEPVVDADVEAVSLDAGEAVPPERRKVLARSGLDGAFEITGLPPGPVAIRARASEFLPWSAPDGFHAAPFDLIVPFESDAPPFRLAIMMARPRGRRGVATFFGGEPLGHARLLARAWNEAWSSETTTDAEGRFSIDVGEGRRFVIEATTTDGDVLRSVDPRTDVDGNFFPTFGAPRVAKGIVLDATTRLPVPDAEIIPRRDDDLGPSVVTDAGGRFRARLRETDVELQAAAFGYGIRSVPLSEGADLRALVVTLEPTAIVAARIGEKLLPRARGAVFTLAPADARIGEAGRSLIPDATGYADFTGVFEGRWRLALVSDEGDEYAAREIEVPARGVVDVVF